MNRDQSWFGFSPQETIDVFLAEYKYSLSRDGLPINESLFAPFRNRLVAALPDALTLHLMVVLQDAAINRRPLEEVVQYVEQQRVEEEHKHQLGRRSFFPWEDIEACQNDKHRSQLKTNAPAFLILGRTDQDNCLDQAGNCPSCGRHGSDLSLIYFSSPAWTWEKLCGRAGWLVLCELCRIQVAFFCEVMN